MTDQLKQTAPLKTPSPELTPPPTVPLLPAHVPSSTPEPEADEPEGNAHLVRWIVIGLAGLIAVIIILLLVAIFGAIFNAEGIGNFFRILRDFFIIVLAIQGILISIALIVLVLQVSALISLIRTEIKPIVDETRQTMSTIRGTAQFVSKNVASPIIRTTAVVSGAMAFLREVTQIQRNIRGGDKKPSTKIGLNGKDK